MDVFLTCPLFFIHDQHSLLSSSVTPVTVLVLIQQINFGIMSSTRAHNATYLQCSSTKPTHALCTAQLRSLYTNTTTSPQSDSPNTYQQCRMLWTMIRWVEWKEKGMTNRQPTQSGMDMLPTSDTNTDVGRRHRFWYSNDAIERIDLVVDWLAY